MRVADVIARWIVEKGVQHVFLLPGGGAMHLNDGVACCGDLEPIVCNHEQACGIAAEAYGRVGNSPFGVAMVTTGPGMTNIVTAVTGAWIDSLPMFVIAGQVKRSDALKNSELRQGGVQEVDALAILKGITKYCVRLDVPQNVRRDLDEAHYHMLNGRPGPVFIEVPLDIQAAPVNVENLTRFVPPTRTECTALNSQLRALNLLLANSERPLILAGHGIRISKAADMFSKLVEYLSIPCVFTWNASDLLPWDHPLYVGRPGVVAARAANFAVQNCDLLIAVGSRIDNVLTGYNSKGFARAAKKVVVDVDENELRKHQFDPEITIKASAVDFLSQWHAVAPNTDQRFSQWAGKCKDWKSRYPPGDKGALAVSKNPVSHIEFVHTLSDAIPPGALIATGSSGLAVEFFYAAFKNKVSQRYFLTSGLGSMGYGLPAAVGACIGSGRRPTICVESDGSFMLNIQELATITAYQLPISIIIMNNDGYASIRNTQKNYFSSRYIGSNKSSGLQIPQIHRVAESFGVPSLLSSDLEELRAFINTPSNDGPRLINFVLRAEDSLSPKVSAMPQSDGTIVSMPLEDMSPLLPIDELELEMIVPLHPQSYAVRAQN